MIFLLVSLVFMVSLLAGVVNAAEEGIGKALGKMGEIFSSMTGVVSLDKILGGDRIALAYAYFIIWLIFFGATYYGTGFIFKDKPRIQTVVAIGFSLFVLMIPPATMTGIAKSYSLAFTLIIWLVPVAVAFVLAWKVESKAMKAILFFALLFLLSQADNVVVNYFNPSFKESGFYDFFYIFYIVAIFGFIWSLITMWGWDPFSRGGSGGRGGGSDGEGGGRGGNLIDDGGGQATAGGPGPIQRYRNWRQNRRQMGNIQQQANIYRRQILGAINGMNNAYRRMMLLARRMGMGLNQAIRAARAARTPTPEQRQLLNHYQQWINNWNALYTSFATISNLNQNVRNHLINSLQQVP